MQRHGRDENSARDEFGHEIGGEGPAGARHLRAARLEGEDRLVGVERQWLPDVAVADRAAVLAQVRLERFVEL
jgi:hypothetical protein